MSPRLVSVAVIAVAVLCASAMPACTSGVGLSSPRAMNHPVDVAFACFDTSIAGSPNPQPLASCRLFVDVSSNTRQPPLNTAMHMHALVTQSTRGEVGAVDLIARTELDSDQSLPGYTFVPVGELPTQIIVPPLDPTCTYVASRGPVDGRHPGISIIDTRRFRSGAGLDHDPFPVHAPFILPSAPSDMQLAPDGQSLWLALDALGVLVRVPIRGSCDLGTIDMVVPLYERTLPSPVTYVDGSTTDLTRECGLAPGTSPVAPDSTPSATPDADPFADPEPVAFAFDVENGMILVADRSLPLIHRVNIDDGTLASPIATGAPLREVVVTPRVPDSYELVPDPQAATMASTACPLHPFGGVAPAPASTVHFSRYLYAIDDTDGTVLAIEYSDPGAPGFGEVIPVDVHGARRPDRISMPIVARSLEIITPQYDTAAADPRFAPVNPVNPCEAANPYGYGLCIPTDPAPTQPPSPVQMRGVFLVVAGSDGALRFVEVYDLDAPCRGRAFGGASVTFGSGSNDCTLPTVTGDDAVYIRRHRPRVQQLLSTFVTVDTGPTLFFHGGGSFVLGPDGRTSDQAAPTIHCTVDSECPTGADLVCHRSFCVSPDESPSLRTFADRTVDPVAAACPAGLEMVWPTPSVDPATRAAQDPLVCSVTDPFGSVSETWSAVYEGTIPGTFTSSANAHVIDHEFVGQIDTRLDYCSLGVVGRLDATAPAGEPEATLEGDMIAITGIIPEANLEGMGGVCQQVVFINQVGEPQQPILARIDRAFTMPTAMPVTSPFSGSLFIDPTTPLENRGVGFATGTSCNPAMGGDATCTDAHPAHPHDYCSTAGACMTFPTIADAVRCYGDTLLTIDVRSFRAFTVSGSRSGFSTRVVRDDATGACVYDTSPGTDPLRQGQVQTDHLFHNARIAFMATGIYQTTISNELAEIRTVLTGGFSQLGIDLSLSSTGSRSMALPAGVRYSPEMWALYAIETERRGLVEMTLRPLAVTQTAYQ